MSPRTSKQFEEIRENKRAQIISAAIECFSTKGYHAVSISELAEFAGISKGLMYNYFKGKDELLRCVFQEIMDTMMNMFDPVKKGLMEKDDLRKYLERFFKHLKSNLVLWKIKNHGYKNPMVEVAFLSTLSSGIIIEYIGDPEHYPLDQIKKRILSLYK